MAIVIQVARVAFGWRVIAIQRDRACSEGSERRQVEVEVHSGIRWGERSDTVAQQGRRRIAWPQVLQFAGPQELIVPLDMCSVDLGYRPEAELALACGGRWHRPA